MRRRIAIPAALLVAVLTTGAVFAIRHEFPTQRVVPPPALAPTVPVVAGVVSSQDVPIYLRGVGTVIAFNTVLVRSQIQGQITKIAFTEGQTVHGQGGPARPVDSAAALAALESKTAKLEREMRMYEAFLRQHGMSVPDAVRHGSSQVIFEDYVVVGYNYRMTDLQAAIGRKQLERLSELVACRRAVAARYSELLGNLEELLLPLEHEWARSNWQSYCVRLPDRLEQRVVMQRLLDQGISTRRGIMCSHREPCYAAEERRYELRQSELAQDHAILLPIFAQMTEEDLVTVTDALRRELYT